MSHEKQLFRRRSLGGAAVLGVCLAAALVNLAGCESRGSKRESLTEPEVKRLTQALKPNRPDQLVVCGETITWEDAIASLPEEATSGPSLKERLQRAALEMPLREFIEAHGRLVQDRLNKRISSIVLSQRAQRDLGQNVDEKLNGYADLELRRFIFEEHGGNGAAADAALQKMGMNRVMYKQWRKKQILAQHLVRSKDTRDRPITYNELLARYEEIKDRRFVREKVFQPRLIDIDVAKMKGEGSGGDALQQARRLAQELRRRLDAGEDFAELAKRYSHDSRAVDGGLWRPRNPDSLASPYEVLAEKAKDVPLGQVIGPIEAPGHFFILRVEDVQEGGYRPLSEVQDEVRKDIMDQRLSAMSDELDTEIAREVSLVDTSRFVVYSLERFYRQVRRLD
ncbi:MAG: peptidyl-prolyl cis-trans isomerase [Planctomycetes bacterium]|jgi:hypothetical protein|nr:peptidyl-prolyl cis-trans isomerase [Planctomycetota bacterium]